MKKITPDFARISLVAGDNFFDIAQVKAEGREENLGRAIEAYSTALSFYTLKQFSYKYALIQNNLGNAYGNMAGVRDPEANLKEAIVAYRETLKVYTINAFPVQYAGTQNNLGAAYYLQGENTEAETCLKKAVEIWEIHLGPDHPYMASALIVMADIYQNMGRANEAKILEERAEAIRSRSQ